MNIADIRRIYDRFSITLSVQKSLQVKTVKMIFTETEMKEMVYLFGELKAIKEQEADDLK